jgi:hypothetical protein
LLLLEKRMAASPNCLFTPTPLLLLFMIATLDNITYKAWQAMIDQVNLSQRRTSDRHRH